MRLSVAPVLPVWLIVGLVICVGAIRVTAFIATRHRHAETIGRKAWIRLGLGLAAILCLGIAALRPGDEYQAERPPRPIGNAEQANANVFLVIDRSMQMLANDFVGEQSRMAAVTADLDFVIRTYPGARFEVISYADSARVEWPLSADAWSLLPFVANFDAYGGPDAEWDDNGTRATIVSAPKGLLRDKLNQATHAYPGSGNLIYIFGSGSGPGDWTLEMPRGQVSGGAVFGYGTEQGGYLPDEDADATFRLNEPAMRTAASSLNVPYYQRRDGTVSPHMLTTVASSVIAVDRAVPHVPHPNRTEYYWMFAGTAAASLGVETYDLTRYWLRRRGRTGMK